MKNNNSSTGSIELPTTLTIVFIVLKLCHVIGWSWVWVLSPIWISLIINIGVIIWLEHK